MTATLVSVSAELAVSTATGCRRAAWQWPLELCCSCISVCASLCLCLARPRALFHSHTPACLSSVVSAAQLSCVDGCPLPPPPPLPHLTVLTVLSLAAPGRDGDACISVGSASADAAVTGGGGART